MKLVVMILCILIVIGCIIWVILAAHDNYKKNNSENLREIYDLVISFEKFKQIYEVDPNRWNLKDDYAIYATKPKPYPRPDAEYKFNMMDVKVPNENGRLGCHSAYVLKLEIGFIGKNLRLYHKYLKEIQEQKQQQADNEIYALFLSDVQDNIHRIQAEIDSEMQTEVNQMTERLTDILHKAGVPQEQAEDADDIMEICKEYAKQEIQRKKRLGAWVSN